MPRVRLLLASSLAALLLAGGATAQALEKLKGTTPEQRAGLQTLFLKSKLGLSDAQLPKIEAIDLKYARQMQPILEGSAGPLAKMGEASRVEQAKDAEMQQALSPEQYQKYLALIRHYRTG